MKKGSILFSIILIVAAFISGCGANHEKSSSTSSSKTKLVTLKIGYPGTGNNTASDLLAVGIDKGYFKDELKDLVTDVQFINFSGAGPAINEALASKSLDIGVYGDTPGVTGKANGIDTTLIASGNSALDAAILVSPDSDIKSVKDLKGKRVATTKGSYMHKTLVQMLQANGLSINDIQFINMNTTDFESSLISKKIDAIVDSNVGTAKLIINKQAKVLLDCRNNPEWKGLNLVISRTQFAKDNPEVIEALIRGFEKAKKFVAENPEETKQIWAKSGTPKAAYDYIYPGNDFGDTFNVEVNKNIIDKLNNTKTFLKDNKLIKGDFNINTWVNNTYYEKSIKK
ncbi:MAG: aliphatic sulfonate ABC transporter substrate-binding protein [Bacillota bacterium]|nr:aliphatic sulfonate ABC transporter substrate-binding protein [Bacillota bacterium]